MLYFAYGMNTNSKKMSSKCRRLGPAIAHHYHWELIKYANVRRKKNATCVGILWDIDEKELKRLDKREGYPICYIRKTITVMHEGIEKKAFIYTMTREYRSSIKNKRPSKNYVNMITEGFAEDDVFLVLDS